MDVNVICCVGYMFNCIDMVEKYKLKRNEEIQPIADIINCVIANQLDCILTKTIDTVCGDSVKEQIHRAKKEVFDDIDRLLFDKHLHKKLYIRWKISAPEYDELKKRHLFPFLEE